MINFTRGDMFAIEVDVRVNTVNCVGVMGTGVALAFKTRYPHMFRAYKKACEDGTLKPGTLNVWRTLSEWIVNFPTKRHWRENSRYDDIEAGLNALRLYLDSIQSPVRVAIPALGCGNGGLDWNRVSKMIETKLSGSRAELFVFEPGDSRRAGQSAIAPSTAELVAQTRPSKDIGLQPSRQATSGGSAISQAAVPGPKGLFLSAMEVKFTRPTFLAAEIAFHQDTFDELRARTDVFVYRRQDRPEGREVLAFPLTGSATLPRECVELAITDNLWALGALVQHRLSSVLSQLDLHQRRRPRNRLRRINRGDDLVAKSMSAARITPSPALSRFHKYLTTELELRVVANERGVDVLAMAVAFHRKFEIDGDLADLAATGFNTTGLDVLDLLGPPQDRYLGTIHSINGESARIRTGDEIRVVATRQCLVEPSMSNFARAFEQELSLRDHERYVSNEWNAQSATTSGNGYTRNFNRFCEYFHRQVAEITHSITCNFIGPIEYSTKRPSPARRLEDVEYCFSGDRASLDTIPSRGLERFGPYDNRTFEKKQPRLLVVTPSQHQGEAETFVKRLRDGMQSERQSRFARGMVGTYRLSKLELDWLPVTLPAPGAPGVGAHYVKALRERLQAGDAPDVALVILRDNDAFREEDNPYLAAKAHLLSHGVPVQQVRMETIRQRPANLAYSLENIAVALYAKLGGSPWTVIPTMPVADEIVIGVGVAESGGRSTARQRFAGITTVFRSDGSYVLAAASERCRYEDFPSVLIGFIQRILRRLSSEQGWERGDHVRLIFHSHQPLKRTDIFQLIDKAVREAGEGVLFQSAFLTVRHEHPFKLVDANEAGRDRGVQLATGGFGKKRVGVHVPQRGTVVDLGHDRRLLCVTGSTLVKRDGEPIPNPLLLELHPASTYRDIDSLTRQAFHFTGLSWRSMHPVGDPVTIFYSHLVAENLVRLSTVPGWSDHLLDTRLRRSRWFL